MCVAEKKKKKKKKKSGAVNGIYYLHAVNRSRRDGRHVAAENTCDEKELGARCYLWRYTLWE